LQINAGAGETALGGPFRLLVWAHRIGLLQASRDRCDDLQRRRHHRVGVGILAGHVCRKKRRTAAPMSMVVGKNFRSGFIGANLIRSAKRESSL